MSFVLTSVLYDSPERAESELRQRLDGAAEVVKREITFNEEGERKGEKVVATFPPDEGRKGKGAAEILWAHGSHFTYVSGRSLKSILEYEKDFKERWPQTSPQSNNGMQRTRIQHTSHHQSPVRAADAGRYASSHNV